MSRRGIDQLMPHDVLGTFGLLSNEAMLRSRPGTAVELLSRLQAWHGVILGGRPELRPGELKHLRNRTGSTEFVAPDLVEGTLLAAWDRAARLHAPFQRAVFWLFAVSEVHPFLDGTGRMARAIMTAELVAGGEQRVIVLTMSRNDHLNGLRRLSRQDRPDLLIDVIDRLHRFTNRIDFSTFETARRELDAAHAFVDGNEAEGRGLHLLMPASLR